MRIQFNFNREHLEKVLFSKSRRWIANFCLLWTFIVPLILTFQMSALFLETPPQNIKYVEGMKHEANYYWSYSRGGKRRSLAGLRLAIFEEDRMGDYYLPIYAISSDIESFRDRINHLTGEEVRVGYVSGIRDKLTMEREDRFIITLELGDESLLEPCDTVPAYRRWAFNRALTAFLWLITCSILSIFALGFIQIERSGSNER